MTDLEEQLRHELRTVAERARPESLRPLRVPPPRRRSRTIRWLAPVAAAVAVAGIIVGVTVAGHSGAQRPASQVFPTGMPKYYVTLEFRYGTTQVIRAVVRSSATGAAISSVQLLRAHSRSPSVAPYPLEVTGAANDRAFLITISSGLEILHIAADGHVVGLTRLPKVLYRFSNPGLAPRSDVLSPDGTEVVVPIEPIGACRSCARGIAMYSVTTGVIRKWLLPKGDDQAVVPVNWQGTGDEVFLAFSLNGSLPPYRLLDVARSGGSLLADSRAIAAPRDTTISRMIQHGWVNEGAWLLPDKKTMFSAYAWTSAEHHGSYTVKGRILETSASTGMLLRELNVVTAQVSANLPGTQTPTTVSCYPLSFGPSQVHVLMWCVNGFGRLDGSHFTPLPRLSIVSLPADPSYRPAGW